MRDFWDINIIYPAHCQAAIEISMSILYENKTCSLAGVARAPQRCGLGKNVLTVIATASRWAAGD